MVRIRGSMRCGDAGLVGVVTVSGTAGGVGSLTGCGESGDVAVGAAAKVRMVRANSGCI